MVDSYYWYPRAQARMIVPVMGTLSQREGQSVTRETVTFDLPIRKCRITRNDFNQADEAHVTVCYDEIGVDPRLLSNAVIEIFIGNSSDPAWGPNAADSRFAGIVRTAHRSLMSNDSMDIELHAQDYTTLFLAQKPYFDTGAPDFTQTLAEAWARICDNTGFTDFTTGQFVSNVAVLRDNLIGLPDGVQDIVIGSGVLPRIAAQGKVQPQSHDADAWAWWRTCVDALGLITWISGDQCYVASAPDYYTASDPVVFVWGQNIFKLEEGRDIASVNNKGIHLTSFDPLGGETIESFYPNRNDPNVVRKRVPAQHTAGKSRRVASAGIAPITDYEHMEYNYSCTQETLDIACRRVWEERSRQELAGKMSTTEMVVQRVSGADFDLLSLTHGDQILVQLAQNALDEMRKLPTTQARAQYLQEEGYSGAASLLIANDQGFIGRLQSTMVVRNVVIEYDPDAQHFGIDVDYCSRIDPNTGASDTAVSA